MGGDRAVSYGNEVITCLSEPKIFRHGHFLIGQAGDCRVMNIMQHKFSIPPVTTDDLMYYMIDIFIPEFQAVLKSSGVSKVENNIEHNEGIFIVAVNNRIFRITGDFSVVEWSSNYTAIGSGRDFALGSLYTSSGEAMIACELTPQGRIMHALEAAAEFDPHVRGPFDILEI